MSKKLSGMLILCVALWLSGCSYFRATGPCFGVGCPARTVGQSGQYKPGQAPKAQNATAPHATAPATQPSDSAQVASAPSAAPASAKPKSSAPNKFSEFFAHLIPHHNKAAKPAPAAD